METSGVRAVCYNGCYYVVPNRFDSYYEGLGAECVAMIPEDPDKYKGKHWRDGCLMRPPS